MRTVSALAAAVLCGCSWRPGSQYDVIVDRNASDSIVESTTISASDWESRVPVTLRVLMGNSCSAGERVICVHSAGLDEMQRLRQESNVAPPTGSHPLGLTRLAQDAFGLKDGADIWILNTASGDILTAAIDHELGHAQWLVHTGVSGELMCGASACDAPRVAPGDVAQWISLRR